MHHEPATLGVSGLFAMREPRTHILPLPDCVEATLDLGVVVQADVDQGRGVLQ